MYDEDVSYTYEFRSRAMVHAGLFAFFLILTVWLGSVSAHDIPSKVPKEAREKKNPLVREAAVIEAGKDIYTKLCLSCHGPSGKGDGPAASALSHRLPDLTQVLKPQTDGEVFYKTTKGGGAMPSYEKTLTDTERWQVIHYLRILETPKQGGGR